MYVNRRLLLIIEPNGPRIRIPFWIRKADRILLLDTVLIQKDHTCSANTLRTVSANICGLVNKKAYCFNVIWGECFKEGTDMNISYGFPFKHLKAQSLLDCMEAYDFKEEKLRRTRRQYNREAAWK